MAIFENRTVTVTFDDHLPSVINPPTYVEREAHEMAQSKTSTPTNTVLVPGIGWRLKGYQRSAGSVHEETAAQSGILALARWSTAGNITEFNAFRKAPWTGVTYAGGVQSAGSPVMQKRVTAGDSFTADISGDSSAFPLPDTASDTGTMDRTHVLDSNHKPTDSIMLRFYVPGAALHASGPLITFYFNGPAGDSSGNGPGKGQYALKLWGNGLAQLFETDDDDWLLRHVFQWALPQAIYGAVHFLIIDSDCRDESGFPGQKIVILPSYFTVAEGSIAQLLGAAASKAVSDVRLAQAEQNGFIYKVPRNENNPSVQAPLRIDVRRDVRAVVQVSKLTYPVSGVLYDDTFELDFFPTEDNPFYVQAWGDIPSGSSLNVQLYDAETGTELSGSTLTYSGTNAVERSYTPNANKRHYRVKVSFTSDGTVTPTLTRWAVYRDAVYETPSVTPVETPGSTDLITTSIQDVSISGPRKEAGQDGASFRLIDMNESVDVAKLRGGIPVKIETTYDETSDTSILFRGYTITGEREVRPGHSNGFGDDTNYRDDYQVNCDGEWHRLYQALCPIRYRWYDAENNQFFTVTTIIRSLLLAAYPSSMVDVPEVDIRPFGDDTDALIIEPGTPVAEVVTRLASDYLGAYLIFDPNAGMYGMWRLKEQKTAPYIPLARFYRTPASGKIPTVSAAYGTSTSGSQTVTHTFAAKQGFRAWVEEPEANMVTVFGGASNDSSAGGSERLSQVAVNVNSFNPFNITPGDDGYPDISHPDYTGRLVPVQVVDSTLTTQSAVDWRCRRIYDYACHSREFVSFDAPLILVTEDADTEQDHPRPLRTYDIVELEQDDGTFAEYIIVGCDPFIRKSFNSMARYTLVRPSNMDEKAVLPPRGSLQDMLHNIAKNGIGSYLPPGFGFSGNKQTLSGSGPAFSTPAAFSEPLQDLDPTSATYGEFYFMPDFDGLL